MSSQYEQLLEATIRYLESAKAEGVESVAVEPETLAVLSAPVRKSLPDVRVTAFEQPKETNRSSSPSAKAEPARRPLEVELSVGAPKEGLAKEEAFAELRARALACQKCPHLVSSRKNVVFGVGDINSPLMFVGEAPGADEDEQAEPFVGKAGQLLTRMIQAMGLTRDKVYIANILKCRPDTPGQTFGNRRPTPEEMKTCLPYLLEQIELIRPKAMVALGAVAVEGLFGKAGGITRLRGQFLEFRGTPVMLTYHPAYLLRNQSVSEKRKVWEDLMQVMERLNLPISEKQRGFFMKG